MEQSALAAGTAGATQESGWAGEQTNIVVGREPPKPEEETRNAARTRPLSEAQKVTFLGVPESPRCAWPRVCSGPDAGLA